MTVWVADAVSQCRASQWYAVTLAVALLDPNLLSPATSIDHDEDGATQSTVPDIEPWTIVWSGFICVNEPRRSTGTEREQDTFPEIVAYHDESLALPFASIVTPSVTGGGGGGVGCSIRMRPCCRVRLLSQ